MKLLTALLTATLSLAATGASAMTTVQWATLSAQPNATTVTGSVAGVGVTYSGAIFFSQLSNSGTDFWVDLGYTQGLVNRPVGTDLIALNDAGTKTITFAAPVTDVYLAFTSWNGVTAGFDAPFTVVSQGAGFWGNGSFGVNGASNGFVGNGEVHGVLKFAGTFSSLTFTDTAELWHGFTVGIGSPAVPAIPEPASWAMLIAGFGLVGATLRRRRAVAA